MYRALGSAGGLLLAAVLSACGGGGGSDVSTAFPSVPALGTGEPSAALTGASAKEVLSLLEAQNATKAGEGVEIDSAIRPLAISPFGSTTYRVYVANGTEALLRLSFASHQYEMLDSVGQSTSGNFSEDAADPGTYIFASARVSGAVNTARFRVTTDAVVGTFPFAKVLSNPASHQLMPFVAARNFVKDRADLDGVYNRLGVSLDNGAVDSLGQQVRIHSGGTMLQTCSTPLGGVIGTCPSGSLKDYPVVAGEDGMWLTLNTVNADDAIAFRMARIDGRNVYLAAGTPPGITGRRVMMIALPDTDEAPFGNSAARGGATDGSYGTMTLSRYLYGTRFTRPNATVGGFAYAGALIWGTGNMRVVNVRGSDRYLSIRSNALVVTTSVPGSWGSGAKGYMQIGLVATPPAVDMRSGTYSAFATTGWRHTLALDFDTQTYGMSDEAFHSTGGTFAADPSEPGTFIFHSTRAPTPVNTSKFRVNGAIVGAFPFAVGNPASLTYAVQPFFATMGRALTADIPGTYNRTSFAAAGTGSLIRHQQLRILDGATTMLVCQDDALLSIDSCPAASTAIYTVSSETNWGTRRYVNNANSDDTGEFMMARFIVQNSATGGVEIQNVFVSASDAATNDPARFSIGLMDSHTWPAISARGSSTLGLSADGTQTLRAPWNRVSLDSVQYVRNSSFADGSQRTVSLAIDAPFAGTPGNMRRVSGGTYRGVAMQAGGLVVNAGRTPSFDGIVELGLLD